MRRSGLLPTVWLVAGFALLPLAGNARQEKVSLEVSPDEVKLRLGEGKQLKAEIRGKKGGVKWAVEGSGAGTVSPTGFYQAPTYGTTPATVLVSAVSEEDPEVKAEARIFLEPVSLAIDPPRSELTTGETQQFRARVEGTGDQRVSWTIEGGPDRGRISEGGLFTAPTRFPTPGTITVRATSMADPSKSVTATVQVGQIGIEIRPKELTLQHGQSRRFEARVSGTSNTAVEWLVQGAGMGEVSNSGLYTTPPSMTTPAEVTVIVRSVADPTKTASSRVRIQAIDVQSGTGKDAGKKRRAKPLEAVLRRAYRVFTPSVVRIFLPFDPVDLIVRGPNFTGKSGKRYIPLGGLSVMSASVTNSTNDRLRWELEGMKVGELTEDGVYYAPEKLTTPQMIQIRATSLADPTKSAHFTLHIPPVVVRAEDEEAVVCPLGGAVPLKAVAENTENNGLLWSVEGGEQFGTVTETGLYHPPASITTPAVVRVRAASAADPTKSVMLQVRIPEVGVEVSPDEAEVRPGQSVRLRHRVKGCPGPGDVIWKLTPEVGFISPDGVYQAPAEGGAHVVQVSAILKGDPTKAATATLRLRGR